MINNLDTQKRWITKNKPYIPSSLLIDELKKADPSTSGVNSITISHIDTSSTRINSNAMKSPINSRENPAFDVSTASNNTPPVSNVSVFAPDGQSPLQNVSMSRNSTGNNYTHNDSDIIASYESTSSGDKDSDKRQLCEIESDDELDQLLSKKSKKIPELPKATKPVSGKPNQMTPKDNRLADTNHPVTAHTNDELYLKYINYLQLKANLLTQRYMIFESSSISLDDKKKFIDNTFNEKHRKLELILSKLASLLPNLSTQMCSDGSLDADLKEFDSPQVIQQKDQMNSIDQTSHGNQQGNRPRHISPQYRTDQNQPPHSRLQIPDSSRIDLPTHESDNDDFSDFEITQVNHINPDQSKGVINLSSDGPHNEQDDDLSIHSDLEDSPRQQPAIPDDPIHTPINSDNELEDEFGMGDMEGLRTPTQDVDNDDTDLSGFIDYGDSTIDGDVPDHDYNSDLESLDESQEFRVSKDELDDMKLSQDVAQNFGIEYIQEEEDPEEEDEINDIDMTTQLNDEREVNYEVIEISDDNSDMEDLSIYGRNMVKQETDKSEPRAVPFDDFDDFDDFDGVDYNTKNTSNDYDDDELTELGITTSRDIIKEYERNYPGCEPYIKEIYSTLNKTFKLQNFRSNQFEAIISFLRGQDVFVLMPTGGGKSLCYQLPALVKVGTKNKGTTIVISPLISLMQDQVEHLRAKDVKAGMINSKNNYQEKKQMMDLLRQGELDLVYLSPEMINSSNQIQRIIKQLYDNGLLSKVIVDEAHCISSWGHDFRPDYKGMNFFRTNYPDIPIMALTATANEKVRLDIIHHLNMRQPVILKQSFNRINLFYEIKMKTSGFVDEIKDLITTKYNNQTGIIYCHSKQSCEQISLKLNQFGLNTSFYHAGMTTEDRFKIQLDWQQERIKVICATIAFGMGIDKPNVRFVIHSFIPRNLEGYYQETGRAGRDGLKSDCIMYYSYKDARTLQLMIQRDEEYSETTKENHLNKLRQVIQFCENKTDCRRKQVLLYFNEIFNPKDCLKQCDACLNAKNFKSTIKDVTEVSKDIIKLVQSVESDRVTLLYCQDIFKGSNYSKIQKNGHNQLPYHGQGKSINKLELERIFFHLISEDCLTEYSVFKGGFASNYVKVGKNAPLVLNGRKKISIHLTENSSDAGMIRPRANGPVATNNYSSRSSTNSGGGFVSAKTNQPIRLPTNNYSSMVNKFNEAHIDKCFKELNIIRIQKRNELNFQDSNSIITDNSLKKLSIILPTSKQEFKKFVNNNDQLSYFIYFKSKLMQLNNERKQLMKRASQPSQPSGSGSKGANSRGSSSRNSSQKSKNFKKSNYFKKRNKQKAMPL